MPSSRLDGAAFTSVDWGEEDASRRVRPRTVAFVLALAGVAALFVYDNWLHSGPLYGTYYTRRIDWLFAVSLVVFARFVALPLVLDRGRTRRYWRRVRGDPLAMAAVGYLAAFFVVALLAPELRGIGHVSFQRQLQPPVFFSVPADAVDACVGPVSNGRCHGTWRHPLGTNALGIDVLSMLVYGMREILQVALSAAVLMGVVATFVGATAGYVGGWVDDVLMRYVDVQQTVPAVVVYVLVATLVLRDKALILLAVFFGLLDWGGIARLVRSEVLKRRDDGYVRAARAAGASDFHVVRKHLVPNASPAVATSLSRRVPMLVLTQVGLSFLLLSESNMRSIGELLRRGLASRYVAGEWTAKWWVAGAAVLVVVLTVAASNVAGDAARDALDPHE
ncbi:ABC transporter permease [Halobacterium litoreum]|uniref:ABC transporter permease n=1 Tax=Halobacterium litoreum TaxID=2039234 RepID=A0ABD5NGJ2_9EURY|nr:ABC transporter permease [Halobacterium litoreum]UHH12789.1 ABC transporter permease [Halobacterium litoreum]